MSGIIRRYRLLVTVLALFVPSTSRSDDITEAVTRIDNSNCKLVERLEESEDEYFSCGGYGNIAVTKLIGHDLIALSYGPDARNACVWDQGFISPSGPRDEITWRIAKGEAFATIERWLVEKYNSARNDYDATDWFSVTQIRPQQVCRIGYVRADQPDALDTARVLADRYSANPFDCNTMNAAVIPSMDDDPDFEGLRLGCNR